MTNNLKITLKDTCMQAPITMVYLMHLVILFLKYSVIQAYRLPKCCDRNLFNGAIDFMQVHLNPFI